MQGYVLWTKENKVYPHSVGWWQCHTSYKALLWMNLAMLGSNLEHGLDVSTREYIITLKSLHRTRYPFCRCWIFFITLMRKFTGRLLGAKTVPNVKRALLIEQIRMRYYPSRSEILSWSWKDTDLWFAIKTPPSFLRTWSLVNVWKVFVWAFWSCNVLKVCFLNTKYGTWMCLSGFATWKPLWPGGLIHWYLRLVL